MSQKIEFFGIWEPLENKTNSIAIFKINFNILQGCLNTQFTVHNNTTTTSLSFKNIIAKISYVPQTCGATLSSSQFYIVNYVSYEQAMSVVKNNIP